jgi:hypothetical protein
MQSKKIQLSISLILFLGMASLHAQETEPASGGNASGSGGSSSYSIGQVFSATYSGSNGTVSTGVQQPFEISLITGTEEGKDLSLRFSVYPNPSTNYLTIYIDGAFSEMYSAFLYDITSHQVKNMTIENIETKIDMSNLPVGTYILKIIESKNLTTPKEIKVFKIIKN